MRLLAAQGREAADRELRSSRKASCNCSQTEKTQSVGQGNGDITPTPQPWDPSKAQKQNGPIDDLCGGEDVPNIHLKLSKVQSENTLHWEACHADSHCSGFVYQNDTITIPETGLYYVYSQVTLSASERQNSSHSLREKSRHFPEILTLVSTVTYGPSVGGPRDTTSVLHSAFCFEKGTQVFVEVEHPAQVQRHHNKTFFGAFRVGRAASCSNTRSCAGSCSNTGS